jgi:EcoEI R protein C-terminal/Type I restriction modification DNA specificity domain
VKAIDPDAQEDARLAGGPRAARRLIEIAIAPLTGNPPFRDRILEIRRDYDIKYDETSKDEVLSLVEVPREERAGSLVTSWHGYLAAHRDEITAIQVLAEQRSGGGRGALAQLKEIAARIRRPPYAWTPVTIWDAYETLDKAAGASGASAGVPDLVSLIRFELGLDTELKPYRSVVEERFAGWLLRQEQAGAEFTVDQMWWLERIRDTVAIGVGTTAGQAGISGRELRNVPIPLPPLAEQRRIVEALEDHLSRLDVAQRAVKTNLRRTTLLAKRIITESVPIPGPPHWTTATVADAGSVDLGRQRHPDWHNGPNMRPYLRVANVFEDRIDIGDLMEMDFSDELFERFQLSKGEILLNEGQSPEYLGRPAMYRGVPEKVAFTNSLLRFRANDNVDPEWALLVFRRHMHAGRFVREVRITTNIARF